MSHPIAPPPRRPLPRFGSPDAALAALILAVVGLMIVPLPAWLLDLLIAANLTVSVAVLLVALYVGNALQVAAFPTVLLVTTLVRLALNVSSTRLILLDAYAGEVIQAFGRFVVRGNAVVGAVIFLILALIEFVVIAKGSERVAEVGARFALDSMPGKQLGIDAELRAGNLDPIEAQRRRRQLAREGQFYGAMDGAMKFVKGDVIASFFITLVNLVGGLAIGIGQRDLAPMTALKRYGLLTVGDGLVTQIPTLVIATAAGILVTRVASEDSDTPLGQDLAAQIFGAPRPLLVAGLFAIVLAAVPGLPALPFLLIGALLLVASQARSRQLRTRAAAAAFAPDRSHAADQTPPRFIPLVVPWSLAVGGDLVPLIEDDRRGGHLRRPGLRSAGEAIRDALFRELGVPLPPCTWPVRDGLGSRQVSLEVHEMPARALSLPPELPNDQLAAWVTDQALPVLRDRAAEFVGITETQALLDALERVAPAVVRQVIPKPLSVTVLSDVLRRLVDEKVSIRDLRGILEALAPVAATEHDPLALAEHVRGRMQRTITNTLTGGSGTLRVYLLDPTIENSVREAISRTAAGSFLTLAPAAGRDIVRAVQTTLQRAAGPEDSPPVLLTQPDVRRFVRKLLENDLPALRVISHAELLPETAVSPLGTATLAGPR